MKLNTTKLINARHRKGMTQGELAKRCGVSMLTIFNAENGKDVYPGTGKTICEFLEIELAETVIPIEEHVNDGDGNVA